METMNNKPAHLSELFRRGKIVEVTVGDPEAEGQTFQIYMQKPSSVQHDEAITKARAQGARLKLRYEDPTSDERVSLKHRIATIENRSALIDEIVGFEGKRLRQQAMNEVLYGDVGSDWGGEDQSGTLYLDLLSAHVKRIEEIALWNEDADEETQINSAQDEELLQIIDKLDQFERETLDREQVLSDQERTKHRNLDVEALRDMLYNQTVDAEAALAWYQEYRTGMLYYACRYPDDHRKFYFSAPNDVLDLPSHIQNQLFNAFDELDKGVESVKNLLTPPVSLP